MSDKKILTGNEAIALGVKLCQPDVVAVYPITPQTQITEEISNLDADVIHVESEHSAMAACYGAALAGGRSFTATSSHGLLYMYEMLYWAAGSRIPIVLVNVMRALGSPWNIWPDHNDAMLLRDLPAIQLFAGNCQEAHDFIPIAYALAEETSFLTVVNIEGFALSHSGEPVEPLDQEKVDLFLPKFQPEYKIDVENPRSFGASSDIPDFFFELRKKAYGELKSSAVNFGRIANGFYEKFGRRYDSLENYLTDDAEVVLVTMGTAFETAKIVVDESRKEGKKLGLVKIRLLRPFPNTHDIMAAFHNRPKRIIVVESNNTAVVANELRSLLYRNAAWTFFGESLPQIISFIAGIGGKEIGPEDIGKMISVTKKEIICDNYWQNHYRGNE